MKTGSRDSEVDTGPRYVPEDLGFEIRWGKGLSRLHAGPD